MIPAQLHQVIAMGNRSPSAAGIGLKFEQDLSQARFSDPFGGLCRIEPAALALPGFGKAVLEGADLDLSQLPWRPTLPRADWPFATAEDRAEIPSRIEKAQKEAFEALASTGLARWGGHLNQALRAFADIWVGVETAVVLSCIGRANPEPPRDSSWLRRESKAFGRVNGPLP